MTDILKRIETYKREEIAAAKAQRPWDEVAAMAHDAPPVRGFLGALKAKRMLLLTDVAGVLDKDGELIRQLTVREARAAIADGVATGGMIPKLETAIAAVEAGVEAVVILDGRRPHAMLTELFTEHGAGTMVRP